MPIGLPQLADLWYDVPLSIVQFWLTAYSTDLGFAINHAMFTRNGRCGWLLKPEAIQTRNKNALGGKKGRILSIDVRIVCSVPPLILTCELSPDHIWPITSTSR